MNPTLPGFVAFQHPALTVRNLDRSLRFYRDLLALPYLGRLRYRAKSMIIDFLDAGRGMMVELFSFEDGVATYPSDQVDDDRQEGPRSLGFRVGDWDRSVRSLSAAGVTLQTHPYPPTDGRRAALMRDPDGVALGLVEDRDADPGFSYDLVTMTVSDRNQALAYYSGLLGFPLVEEQESLVAGGPTRSRVRAGEASFELLSFPQGSTRLRPWVADERMEGIKHLGMVVRDVFEGAAWLKNQGVRIIYEASHVLGAVDTCFFADPDGNALELINGTVTYDA